MYGIWKCCERFGMHPPGIRERWIDNTPWQQALLIAYDQVRQNEEMEWLSHSRVL